MSKSLVNTYQRYITLLNDLPHHKLHDRLVLNLFYGGLWDNSKEELDLASEGSFITSLVSEAWELLDGKIANHKAWGSDEEEEGKVDIDFDYITTYLKSGRVNQVSDEFYLDPDVVLRFVKSYADIWSFQRKNGSATPMRTSRKRPLWRPRRTKL